MPSPVEIIYTPEIFSIQAVGGISRYFVELMRGLQAAGEHPRVVAGLHVNEYLRHASGVTGLYLRFAAARAARPRRLLNHALCRAVLALHPRAVVHLTYFGDTSYLRRRQPLVVTVYDMIHELFHDRFPELGGADDPSLRHKRLNCERADHLIAISESTKHDLVRLFALDPARVTVIPLSNSLPVTDLPAPPPAGDSYLLHVGTRSGYKNFRALLEAFGRSKTLPQHFRLVCFGGGPFSDEERAAITALGVEGRVEQRPGGHDDALARCYRGATAFVCPSLYEGFGLPVLEAMGQGCPVLCARAGSLPEVAGDDAAYFDPQDPDSIRVTLETTLADSARLAALRAAGPSRARGFSWERCTHETLAVYRRLAPSP